MYAHCTLYNIQIGFNNCKAMLASTVTVADAAAINSHLPTFLWVTVCVWCRFYGANKICCAYILFNKWIYFGCTFVVFSVSFTTNQFNFNLKFDFIQLINGRSMHECRESERNLIRVCECMREKWTIQLRICNRQCMRCMCIHFAWYYVNCVDFIVPNYRNNC